MPSLARQRVGGPGIAVEVAERPEAKWGLSPRWKATFGPAAAWSLAVAWPGYPVRMMCHERCCSGS